VDRFFFAERLRLQRAMVEMGEAFTNEVEIEPVVSQLVERLPALLGVHFAGLYLIQGDRLVRAAGPVQLPQQVASLPILYDHLKRHGSLIRLDELAPLRLLSHDVERFSERLASPGVEVIGLLATTRRTVGVMVLSGTTGQTTLEQEEMQLLRGLLNQASIALETHLLLDERARRAELERELKIAASIQASLIPDRLSGADGWDRAAVCQPAREIGGDFYTELPGPSVDDHALAYGDVSGKSISGALMMMAAHEVLHSLALIHRDPEDLLRLANDRLHTLRGRDRGAQGGSFVALGYLVFSSGSGCVRYSLAGQPPPLIRRRDGRVEELDMPAHRLPLGALGFGGHEVLTANLEPGDLLLAYSDGVVDAQSPEGDFFGEHRLWEVLEECRGDATTAVARILGAIAEFTNGHTPYDDVTLLAASWRGPAQTS
jgi:serine phosphatase RsbU (regulator of sigma subunit)